MADTEHIKYLIHEELRRIEERIDIYDELGDTCGYPAELAPVVDALYRAANAIRQEYWKYNK